MITILAIFILLIAIYAAIKKPALFILIYTLVGCSIDSFGFVGFISYSTPFKHYSIYFKVLLILCSAIYSLKYYKQSKKDNYCNIMKLSIITIAAVLLSSFLILLKRGFNAKYIGVVIENLSMYSPTIFLIMIGCGQIRKPISLLKIIVISQTVLAFLIIYLRYIGYNYLNFLDGRNYLSSLNYFNYNSQVATFENYDMLLGNKYIFSQYGQFHNPNALGFYSGMCLAMTFSDLIKNIKTLWWSIPLIIISVLCWINAGTRAPIIGLISAIFLSLLFMRKPKKYLLITIIILIAMISISKITPFIEYLSVKRDNPSFSGRVELFKSGINYLSNNFLYGSGGYRDEIIQSEHIFPHQLFLMKGVLYGFAAMLLFFLLVYVYPIKYFIESPNKNFTVTSILCILILQSLTNNETCPALFWIAFSTVIMELKKNSILPKNRTTN